jgi:glucokinase
LKAQRVIGVDLGGTKILAGVVDAAGTVERTHEVATPTSSQAELVDALVAVVEELRTPEIAAAGFGVPGWFDPRTGVVLGAANTPLHELAFASELSSRLGLPVTAANDASVAALAEHRLGAGRGVSDLVLLTLGTGVGGGIVMDGRLYRGWAELGHMVIVENGEPCPGFCTGFGHVESYCSGVAADRLARRVLGPHASGRDLIEQRHPALAEIGQHLGTTIGSLINIFSPEIILLGGGFGSAAGELLLEHARPAIEREALPPGAERTRLALAELGPEAGLIGAGLLALDELE